MHHFINQPIIGELPEQLLRFCRLSIENRRGAVLYTEPDPEHPSQSPADGEYGTLELGSIHENEIIGLTPTPSDRPVAAIDTSTIRLGELEDGSLCALRGAIVLLERKQYKYVRYGPFVFSLGNSLNVDEIPGVPAFAATPNIELLLRRVRNSLERWLQLSVCRTYGKALVLLDGSLVAGAPEGPGELGSILEIARRSDNLVIAISKNTQLRLNGRPITVLLEQNEEPCLLNVDEQIRNQFAFPIQFLGRVFVGKLAKSGFPFRIDIDRRASVGESVHGLKELAGTDIMDRGYPETLRVAHILSTFTASDVLAVQSLAAAQFGVQLMPKIALRRSLFGPFGTRWESRH